MHVITPSDLKNFQLENYKELLLKPRSFKHKIFLKQQIKLLNENDFNNSSNTSNSRLFHRTDCEVLR